jgi:hypothetical protein
MSGSAALEAGGDGPGHLIGECPFRLKAEATEKLLPRDLGIRFRLNPKATRNFFRLKAEATT